jgi:hypothetical protein
MDPTTVLAVTACVIVFAGWVLLPHQSTVSTTRPIESREPATVTA